MTAGDLRERLRVRSGDRSRRRPEAVVRAAELEVLGQGDEAGTGRRRGFGERDRGLDVRGDIVTGIELDEGDGEVHDAILRGADGPADPGVVDDVDVRSCTRCDVDALFLGGAQQPLHGLRHDDVRPSRQRNEERAIRPGRGAADLDAGTVAHHEHSAGDEPRSTGGIGGQLLDGTGRAGRHGAADTSGGRG